MKKFFFVFFLMFQLVSFGQELNKIDVRVGNDVVYTTDVFQLSFCNYEQQENKYDKKDVSGYIGVLTFIPAQYSDTLKFHNVFVEGITCDLFVTMWKENLTSKCVVTESGFYNGLYIVKISGTEPIKKSKMFR